MSGAVRPSIEWIAWVSFCFGSVCSTSDNGTEETRPRMDETHRTGIRLDECRAQ